MVMVDNLLEIIQFSIKIRITNTFEQKKKSNEMKINAINTNKILFHFIDFIYFSSTNTFIETSIFLNIKCFNKYLNIKCHFDYNANKEMKNNKLKH